jgi:hypothetical protein
MITVPDKVAFEYGTELFQILEAAFLPRIIAPNKLNAGDRFIFMKYSGIPLLVGTSMGLSSIGDAYINFGIFHSRIWGLPRHSNCCRRIPTNSDLGKTKREPTDLLNPIAQKSRIAKYSVYNLC